MLRTYRNDHEYYTSLPKKRIGSGVLVFYKSQLLIIQPTYASAWILPGGTIEAEESPLEGLVREVQEELGIKISPTEILAVDYIHNFDVKGEYISFLFAAKDLSEQQAQNIRPSSSEIQEFRFVDIEQALPLLAPNVSRRVSNALKCLAEERAMIYLEDGHLP